MDTDYDGKDLRNCQECFAADAKVWENVERAVKGQIDPEAFQRLPATV